MSLEGTSAGTWRDVMGNTVGAQGTSRIVRVLALVVAAALHLVALVPFTVASGLVAPLWAVVVFHVLWLLMTVVLVRVGRRQPLAAPLVPVGYGLVFVLALTLGERLLGWTA